MHVSRPRLSIRYLSCIGILAVCAAFLIAPTFSQENNETEVDPAKAAFDAQYARITEFVANYHGLRSPTIDGAHLYVELAALGPQVLPYIIPEIEAGDWQLGYAVDLMTQISFERNDYDDPAHPGGSQQYAAMLCRWWRAGKAASDARFEHLYGELIAAREAGDQEAVDATLLSLGKLGIAALPNFVEKIQQGDPDLTGVVVKVTSIVSNGRLATVSADATPAEVAKWWETDKQYWLIPWPEGQSSLTNPSNLPNSRPFHMVIGVNVGAVPLDARHAQPSLTMRAA